jgi:hypothetical protein
MSSMSGASSTQDGFSSMSSGETSAMAAISSFPQAL